MRKGEYTAEQKRGETGGERKGMMGDKQTDK